MASTVQRFWNKVDKSGNCWLYGDQKDLNFGLTYGRFTVVPATTMQAHRFAYEMVHGPIPDGLVIDHLCRTRHCVRPEHMEVVTMAENLRRAIRAKQKAKSGFKATRRFIERRERRGETQAALARRIGIDGSYVSTVESGKRLLGPRSATRIAKAVGLTLAQAIEQEVLVYFVGGHDARTRVDGRTTTRVKRRVANI